MALWVSVLQKRMMCNNGPQLCVLESERYPLGDENPVGCLLGRLCRGYIGVIQGFYRVYIGTLEKKMEASRHYTDYMVVSQN